MPKLPVMSGADVSKKPLTVPLHTELKPGLLNQILKDADISREQFGDL